MGWSEVPGIDDPVVGEVSDYEFASGEPESSRPAAEGVHGRPAMASKPNRPEAGQALSVVADLSANLAAVAEGDTAPDSHDAPSPEAPAAAPTGSPLASEAALAIADELLLSVRDTRPRSDGAGTPGSDAGPAGLRLLVDGRELDVPAGGAVLGRQPGPAGILVADSCVSRRHARVRPTGAGMAVADLGSTNGTVVVRGEVRIDATREDTAIADGDLIMTANGVLLAQIVGEPGGGQP